jgi:hypothetical protein
MAVTTTDVPRTTDASPATETRTERGASLARGPALILGTILLVAGLYFMYKQHTFLKFSNFPSGNAPVQGKVFLGIFGVNGWSGMFTAAAGGLLLFGAAEHMLAKTMSLIVGVALGAAAIIALVSGNVLGMAAANHWTELLWGGSAVILLFNVIVPRRTWTVAAEPGVGTSRPGMRRHRAETAAAGAEAERIHERHQQQRNGEAIDERPGGEEQTAVANRDAAERD